MEAKTYHPYTVGRQARKGGEGGGTTVQVIDNLNSTSATDALSANQGHQLKETIEEVEQKCKVKKELLEVTDLTFIWNQGYYTSEEDTGLHNGSVYKRLSTENSILRVKFKGFYTKDSQGNYSKINNFSDMPQIKENGTIPEGFWQGTDVNFNESPFDYSKVGTPQYSNLTYPYPSSSEGYIAATYSDYEFNNICHFSVELVLLTPNQGIGTTEQQVRDLYNWPTGTIGLFELTYI